MDCFAAGSQPLFFDQHITAVRPVDAVQDSTDRSERDMSYLAST